MTCFAKFLANRLRSFGFALHGLGYALKTQGNMRVHLLAALLVMALGWAVGVSRMEAVALVGAIGLVVMAELLNSAVETLCDYVEPARVEAIKHTKDMAAGAVLVAAVAAATIGGLVFYPYLFP
jgi:diacylglycerol kinase (ATP)